MSIISEGVLPLHCVHYSYKEFIFEKNINCTQRIKGYFLRILPYTVVWWKHCVTQTIPFFLFQHRAKVMLGKFSCYWTTCFNKNWIFKDPITFLLRLATLKNRFSERGTGLMKHRKEAVLATSPCKIYSSSWYSSKWFLTRLLGLDDFSPSLILLTWVVSLA